MAKIVSTESLDGVAAVFLLYCERRRRLDPKTIKAYRGDLRQLCVWLTEREARQFNSDAAKAWIEHLNSLYAPSSVKRKVSTAKAFGEWAVDTGFLEESPFSGMRIRIRQPKLLPRTIAISDINSIFSEAYKQPSTQVRPLSDAAGVVSPKRRCTMTARNRLTCEQALLELLIATGVRVSELCSLDIDDVDMGGRTARIMGKGTKERMVQLENQHTLAALSKHIANRMQDIEDRTTRHSDCTTRALFVNRLGKRMSDQSIRDIVRKHAEGAGVFGRITPHMFRHTFATLLLESDIDIRYIQQLLGHSSIRTTEIYTHVASSKLRDILRESNPRNAVTI